MAMLEVKNLFAGYFTETGYSEIIKNVSFEVEKGEMIGIAGESGAGKTTLISAIYNSLIYPGNIESGTVFINGTNILEISGEKLRKMRGRDFSYAPQGSMDSLNPVKKIGDQFRDLIQSHGNNTTLEQVVSMLSSVGIEEKSLDRYPHELSGGMKQRIVIAMALILGPSLVILDEPTTGLDVLVQFDILTMIKKLQSHFDAAFILVTHDIALLFQIAEKILVIYAGKVMEYGKYEKLLRTPKHPYTRLLLESIPSISRPVEKLYSMEGEPISADQKIVGCVFASRCPFVRDECKTESPELVEDEGVKYACIRYPDWQKEVPKSWK